MDARIEKWMLFRDWRVAPLRLAFAMDSSAVYGKAANASARNKGAAWPRRAVRQNTLGVSSCEWRNGPYETCYLKSRGLPEIF